MLPVRPKIVVRSGSLEFLPFGHGQQERLHPGRKTSGHEDRPAPGFLHAGPNLALDAIWELTGGSHLRKDATFFIDDQARSRHESITGIRKAAGKTEGQKEGSIGPSPSLLPPYNASVDLPQLVVKQRLPTQPRFHCNTSSTASTKCSAWFGVLAIPGGDQLADFAAHAPHHAEWATAVVVLDPRVRARTQQQ